jgi:hypothetical protein
MPETTGSLLAYVEKRADVFSKKLKCPNHSDGIIFDRFKEASAALAEPFSKAVDKYHANKWN